ncbi:MAG TPA: methyltransferase domain-containing protein [Pyrinomonadaceae bacterium]|nr:methyltransferase domain-containing protein [Pyrinomonadaceae bacterium]
MSAIPESEILQEWRDSAQFWQKHAQTIRNMFAPLTVALIEEAGITEGDRVLDVAAGPGEPSLTITEVVGPSGLVTCTDAVPDMVAAAKREAERRHVTNIEFKRCDATSLPFTDQQFDASVSRLGVMFFPDPVLGMCEMLRVTKAGGHVALVVWAGSELNPFSYIVTNIVSEYIDEPPAPPSAAGAFRYAEPGTLAAHLKLAGAGTVRERPMSFNMRAAISPAEFWTMRSETSGTLREKLMKLDDQKRHEIGAKVQEAVREYFPNNQMSFPAQMIIVTGTRQALP